MFLHILVKGSKFKLEEHHAEIGAILNYPKKFKLTKLKEHCSLKNIFIISPSVRVIKSIELYLNLQRVYKFQKS